MGGRCQETDIVTQAKNPEFTCQRKFGLNYRQWIKRRHRMTTWLNIVAVAGGGAIGSVCRYLLALFAAFIPGGSSLWGTIAANVLGCALIGAFATYVDIRNLGQEMFPERLRLAIQVGFLGGLTTYSTFAAEKAMLIGSGRIGLGSAYIAANILLGWLVLVLAAEGVKSWMN